MTGRNLHHDCTQHEGSNVLRSATFVLNLASAILIAIAGLYIQITFVHLLTVAATVTIWVIVIAYFLAVISASTKAS
jgi:hypothetical protein